MLSALKDLHELRFFDLRANRLTHLPPWLAQLPRLEKLDFRWNQIDTVPDEFTGFIARGGVVWV